ncbi:hypothetical protein N1F78_15535 [Seonamhaeicola sp. MEBiC1930]|uniref:hypothetical protein n=1 Tax=Seonamhaeicola sp. MEBiC01930 TaxID=2976768 RepID=UPI003246B2E3
MKTLKSLYLLIFLFTLLFTTSCESTEPCEEDNTGTVIIENTNSDYSLHFYKSNSVVRGNGDLVIEPQSKGSITLPAGSYSTYLKLFTGSCNPDTGRCLISWELIDDDKEIELSSCEDLNLIY